MDEKYWIISEDSKRNLKKLSIKMECSRTLHLKKSCIITDNGNALILLTMNKFSIFKSSNFNNFLPQYWRLKIRSHFHEEVTIENAQFLHWKARISLSFLIVERFEGNQKWRDTIDYYRTREDVVELVLSSSTTSSLTFTKNWIIPPYSKFFISDIFAAWWLMYQTRILLVQR